MPVAESAADSTCTVHLIVDSAWIGVIGGALGALAVAGPTIYAARRSAAAQTAVAEQQAQARLEQLRELHSQKNLEHRQRVYHRFLMTIWRLNAVMDQALPVIEAGTIFHDDWKTARTELMQLCAETRELFEGLRLFGAPDVVGRADDLDGFFFARAETDLRVALLTRSLEELRAEHLREFFDDLCRNQESINNWTARLADLREAMRADVGTFPRGSIFDEIDTETDPDGSDGQDERGTESERPRSR